MANTEHLPEIILSNIPNTYTFLGLLLLIITLYPSDGISGINGNDYDHWLCFPIEHWFIHVQYLDETNTYPINLGVGDAFLISLSILHPYSAIKPNISIANPAGEMYDVQVILVDPEIDIALIKKGPAQNGL